MTLDNFLKYSVFTGTNTAFFNVVTGRSQSSHITQNSDTRFAERQSYHPECLHNYFPVGLKNRYSSHNVKASCVFHAVNFNYNKLK